MFFCTEGRIFTETQKDSRQSTVDTTTLTPPPIPCSLFHHRLEIMGTKVNAAAIAKPFREDIKNQIAELEKAGIGKNKETMADA